MTGINRLNINAVRNIDSCTIDPSPSINLIHGENGSGKTSVLEAIQTLATGKSFRSSKLDTLVKIGCDELTVYAELIHGHRVGFSKKLKQPATIVLDGDKTKSWEHVARALPTLVLESSSFQLVDGGPKIRRSYLDWGVFHVEPNFIVCWRKLMRCLTHRNKLLKQRSVNEDELSAWSNEFCICAAEVDRLRSSYLAKLVPYFDEVLKKLVPETAGEFQLVYQRGWDVDEDLGLVLRRSHDLDRKYGATQSGPHRAEIAIRVDGVRAADLLSRGQSKLLVIALKISQGQFLADSSGHQCSYLVDDLAAELDLKNRGLVLSLLISQGAQLFLTAVNKADLLDGLDSSLLPATFHVERGIITS
jgi:DNA replication and repair protein RecF